MRVSSLISRAVARPRPGTTRTISDAALGRAALALAAAAVAVLVYAVHAAMPANPIQLPLENPTSVRLLLPQGWAFFTASPRTVYPQAYERSAGRWVHQGGSLAVPSGLLGLNRSGRARSSEIALLVQDVPGTQWRPCSTDPLRCLAASPVSAHLVNTSALRNLCGAVGFVQQQVLPWAWRGTATIMPSLVLRTEVSCRPAR
jgi:antimicrobial peptide system SdpA family protein